MYVFMYTYVFIGLNIYKLFFCDRSVNQPSEYELVYWKI